MKIRTRLIGTAIVCLFPMWIGIAAVTAMGMLSDKTKSIDLIEEYTGSIVTGLVAFFDNAAELAGCLAGLQGEMQLEWADGGSQLFEALVSRNATVRDAGRVDENGYCYITGIYGNPWQGRRMTEDDSDPNAAPVSLAGTDYFSAYIEGNRGETQAFVVEPYIPLGLDYKAIVTGAPIMRDGRCIGAANAMQTSAELSSLYAGLTARFMERFGTEAQMHLLSEGGQLVSSLAYSEEHQGYRDALFGTNEIVSSGALGSEALSIFDDALRGEDNVIEAKLGGRACYVSSTRIGSTPFMLCFAVPQSAMLSVSRNMLIVSIVLFLGMTIAMLCGMYAITRALLSSLGTIGGTMAEIAEGGGDLTARLEVKRGNDEIAAIGNSFNRFVATLNTMIGNVSKSAESMSEIGQGLSNNASDISGRVFSITQDIENLNFATDEQSASVTETSGIITEITQNIESLSNQIENQTSAVTESSAAVQELVSNINSISANVSRASTSFDELKADAADGKGSITHVQELVQKLSSQSDSLLEANSVIESIASQTNLLAMNAAIEAAHAGDAGKGFAIVAEEIRNLAENSAEQSRAIASVLKETVKAVKNIANAANVADSSFDSVVSKIETVSALVGEINFSMSEQSAGSRQVLEGLQDIENITAQIRDGAVEMNSGTETILKEVSRLSAVSQSVQERSASIARAADAINNATAKIVQSSENNSNAVQLLIDMTSKFKLL